MSEEVLTPSAVYFDTNPLIGAGWPAPSAQLLELLGLAERLGIPLFLPEIVQQELEEHWVREIQEKWRNVRSASDGFNRRAAGLLTVAGPEPLPGRGPLRAAVRNHMADFTRRFTQVSTTKRPLSEFLELAMTRGATFKDGGHGFQDAVILCSIFDHLIEAKLDSAILVTADDAFMQGGVGKLAQAAGKTIRIVKTLDELESVFRSQLQRAVLEHMEAERKRLLDLVAARLDDLAIFVRKNLVIDKDQLPVRGRVKKIDAIDVVSIENAHRSWPWWKAVPQDKTPVTISVDVKVMFHLEVEHYTPPTELRLKIGETVPEPELPPNALRSLLALIDIQKSQYGATVTVEAELVERESGSHDINFTSVRLKDERYSLADVLAGLGPEAAKR